MTRHCDYIGKQIFTAPNYCVHLIRSDKESDIDSVREHLRRSRLHPCPNTSCKPRIGLHPYSLWAECPKGKPDIDAVSGSQTDNT